MLLTKICYGEPNNNLIEFIDLNTDEIMLLILLAVPTIFFGIYGQESLVGLETITKFLLAKLG
jgi:NADH:ubiquinone oxidoreductase subunit 4 (subunit M)